MLSGLLDYLESDQRAPLQRYSKYSELDAKNGTSLHEYFNLSVLTGRYRRGVESKVLPKEWLCYQLSILDQNLLVSELLFVKVRIFKQLTRCQFDKMIETLSLRIWGGGGSSPGRTVLYSASLAPHPSVRHSSHPPTQSL